MQGYVDKQTLWSSETKCNSRQSVHNKTDESDTGETKRVGRIFCECFERKQVLIVMDVAQ